jgi:hypothetical protein
MFKPSLTGAACLLMLAYAQEVPPAYPLIRPNQEVRVNSLPSIAARSHDRSDVLLTSLDIIFRDHSICCGWDSALEDSAAATDPRSLKDIINKLGGRHLLSDGRPIMVTVVDLAPTASRNPASIVDALKKKHALLFMWNSRLYVLYGALFDEALYNDGSQAVTIHQLFLLDTRYPDSRRKLVFSREKNDWNQVEGLLLFAIAPQ